MCNAACRSGSSTYYVANSQNFMNFAMLCFWKKIICYYIRNSVFIKKKKVSSPYTYVECYLSTSQSKMNKTNNNKQKQSLPQSLWLLSQALYTHVPFFFWLFFCCWHFCSCKSMDALKERFGLSCLSLPCRMLLVINIIPSDCGVSNGIPSPKITKKITLCSYWESTAGNKGANDFRLCS